MKGIMTCLKRRYRWIIFQAKKERKQIKSAADSRRDPKLLTPSKRTYKVSNGTLIQIIASVIL